MRSVTMIVVISLLNVNPLGMPAGLYIENVTGCLPLGAADLAEI